MFDFFSLVERNVRQGGSEGRGEREVGKRESMSKYRKIWTNTIAQRD